MNEGSFPTTQCCCVYRHQEQHTAGSDESNSDLSIELPKRKTSAFRRGKKSVAKEVQSRPNVFAKVLEETIDQNEESAGATLIEANMSLPKKSSRYMKISL